MKKAKSVSCMILIFALLFCGCGNGTAKVDTKRKLTPFDFSSFEKLENSSRTFGNDSLSFCIDSSAHFTIKDLKTGNMYYSSAFFRQADSDFENTENCCAEMVIHYYGPDGKMNAMNSKSNSVDFGGCNVSTKGNKAYVSYTFSLQSVKAFVPPVLDGEIYKKISENADDSDKFKLKLLYKKYKPDDETVEANEIHSKYPFSKKSEIYVIKNSVDESDKNVIVRCCEKAGYGQEDYYSDIENIGIVLDPDDVPVSFTVPVIYTVEGRKLNAEIDVCGIVCANTEYTLQAVEMLPYFNCGVIAEDDSFILVPDGTGSIIDISKADNASYSQRIYGEDLSCKSQRTGVIAKNATMPVFGMSTSKGSYFAIIKSAEASASVIASRAGTTNYCAHAYSSFDVKTVDDYKMRKSTVLLSVFSKDYVSKNPEVEYCLLDSRATVSDMAKLYSDFLNENSLITEKKNINNGLFLDYTGYVTTDASFMGIPYQKKTVLSKISDIVENIKSLNQKGIKNITVRLSGYGNGGKYHYLTEKFDLYSGVGTVEELKVLSELLEKQGGTLVLETDFANVYKDSSFDGFNASRDAVKMLDKTLADISDYDIVSQKESNIEGIRYLLSPIKYKTLAEKYIDSFKDKAMGIKTEFSFGFVGKTLLSDFREDLSADRIQTEETVSNTAKLLGQIGGFATDVGNAYSWKYSNRIFNAPLSDSGFGCEKQSVPLYSMAIGNNISYCGTAYNTSPESDALALKLMINGANPLFEVVTSKEALTSLNSSQKMLPAVFDSVFDDIVEFYKKYGNFYSETLDKIENYKIIDDGVSMITYKNGSVALFNQNDKEYVYRDIVIGPESFKVKGDN